MIQLTYLQAGMIDMNSQLLNILELFSILSFHKTYIHNLHRYPSKHMPILLDTCPNFVTLFELQVGRELIDLNNFRQKIKKEECIQILKDCWNWPNGHYTCHKIHQCLEQIHH